MPGSTVKQIYATPETRDFDAEGIGNGEGINLAGSAELGYIKLNIITPGSAVVYIYDGKSAEDETDDRLKIVLDAGGASPDTLQPTNPLAFGKGIRAVLGNGANQGAIVSFSVVMPQHKVE